MDNCEKAYSVIVQKGKYFGVPSVSLLLQSWGMGNLTAREGGTIGEITHYCISSSVLGAGVWRLHEASMIPPGSPNISHLFLKGTELTTH